MEKFSRKMTVQSVCVKLEVSIIVTPKNANHVKRYNLIAILYSPSINYLHLQGLKSTVTSTCNCNCQPCPKNTVLCPSANICINSTSWCDGVMDCPDDEVNCPKKTTEQLTTTTTIAPITTKSTLYPRLVLA